MSLSSALSGGCRTEDAGSDGTLALAMESALCGSAMPSVESYLIVVASSCQRLDSTASLSLLELRRPWVSDEPIRARYVDDVNLGLAGGSLRIDVVYRPTAVGRRSRNSRRAKRDNLRSGFTAFRLSSMGEPLREAGRGMWGERWVR